MILFRDIPGSLAFQGRSLVRLARRRSFLPGLLFLSAGFLAYVLVRNTVYADLQPEYAMPSADLLARLLRLDLVQFILFLSVLYVPALIALGNALTAEGPGFTVSRDEYLAHASLLFPLWGAVFLIAAPVQWLLPYFVVLGPLGISIGLLFLSIALSVYTVWALGQWSRMSIAAAFGVFALSWITLPVFFLLSSFPVALPLFLLLPLAYFIRRYAGDLASARAAERDLRRYLQALTADPNDSHALCQLGRIHFRQGRYDSARDYLRQAVKIDARAPEYRYTLGRVLEAQGDWPGALARYEEAYGLDPGFGAGDISREMGKACLHAGSLGKAVRFLQDFLKERPSDPEGRYWLAVALEKSRDREGMRVHLNILLDHARSSTRLFRRKHQEWIRRARMLLDRPEAAADFASESPAEVVESKR